MREIKLSKNSTWWLYRVEEKWEVCCPSDSSREAGYDEEDVLAAQRVAAEKYTNRAARTSEESVRVDPGTIAVRY